jgi:3'(2'), 5'-bisphosphate nucleotidase
MVELNSINQYLYIALNAALKAGDAIRKVYFSDQVMVEYKEDLSPITLADRHAHECIEKELETLKLPVLSEEGIETPYEERKDWNYFWLVDPLDGTKEFIKRNDEFTVNIALIEKREPILGVIYSPINGMLFFGARELGSFKRNNCFETEISEQTLAEFITDSSHLPLEWSRKRFSIAVSKSHMNEKTLSFVNSMIAKFSDVETISMGSSLKICLVAEGRADIYPRFGKTMEWDTAAGHAIAQAAGFSFTLPDGESPFRYNKPDLANPNFLVKRKDLIV